MRHIAATTALLGMIWAGNVIAQKSPEVAQDQKQKQKKSPPKAKTDSMTGCIDQQDGRYVLLNDRTRDAIADLEADGFETEGFAKHVGQKVTVRGTKNPPTDRPLFRVRSIETVSESCEPQAL